jgi:hypothetical protein
MGEKKYPYPEVQLPYAEGIITITGLGGASADDVVDDVVGDVVGAVFGDESHHDICYKTLSWQMVAVLMIAEIVSNGMLSLPSTGGVIGVGTFCLLP